MARRRPSREPSSGSTAAESGSSQPADVTAAASFTMPLVRATRRRASDPGAGTNVQGPPGIEIPGYFVKALRSETARPLSGRFRVPEGLSRSKPGVSTPGGLCEIGPVGVVGIIAGTNAQGPPGIEIPGYFVKAHRAETTGSRSGRLRVPAGLPRNKPGVSTPGGLCASTPLTDSAPRQ